MPPDKQKGKAYEKQEGEKNPLGKAIVGTAGTINRLRKLYRRF